MAESHRIEVPLDEDCAMVTSSLAIVSYLDKEGTTMYQVHFDGSQPLSNYLGLTVMAQQDLMEKFYE